jgi:hypothetical protein
MWRLYSEISVTRESSYLVKQVLDKMLLDLKELRLPPEIRVRIAGSIRDAIAKAKISTDYGGTALPLVIQVLLEENDREGNHPDVNETAGEFNHVKIERFSDPSQLVPEAQNVKRSIYKGWGYFLVEKGVDRPKPAESGSPGEIRIFLYKEGAES